MCVSKKPFILFTIQLLKEFTEPSGYVNAIVFSLDGRFKRKLFF